MLFHGTDERNVNGILNKGFVNSAQGMFGKGVYMTESANTARIHSLKKKPKRKYENHMCIRQRSARIRKAASQ